MRVVVVIKTANKVFNGLCDFYVFIGKICGELGLESNHDDIILSREIKEKVIFAVGL